MRNLSVILVLIVTMATGCPCGIGGKVCVGTIANSSFNQFTHDASDSMKTWLNEHYTRMVVYAPDFDSRLDWYPNGWVYKNMYAIHVGTWQADDHPDWILRDAYGNRLYIPYACGGGTCPQYAGDVGNPAFRANWLSEARSMMAAGYKGMFLDDFNMRLQIGNGNGDLVTPMNPRTGREMTTDEWRDYMADFATEIRHTFPEAELVQNQVYFFASPSDPNVIRATQQANFVWIERAFNDGGLVNGTGKYGFETLLAWVDAIHAAGAGTIEEIQADWGAEYALACYFLTSTGLDGLVNRHSGWPTNWWSGYEVDLGDPIGWPKGRYRWNGLFRRDFTDGMVLVNQPGVSTVTVDLGGTYRRLDGSLVTRVTLDAWEGVVLRPV